MSWTYTVDKGIKDPVSGQSIEFEATRDSLRKQLKFDPVVNVGRFDREDSYESLNSSGDWIRLSFDDENKLREIEILSGTVCFNDKEITIDGDLRAAINSLESLGTKFIEHEYGFVSLEIKIDLGDSDKSGGDDNKISWFYCSTDISHILE